MPTDAERDETVRVLRNHRDLCENTQWGDVPFFDHAIAAVEREADYDALREAALCTHGHAGGTRCSSCNRWTQRRDNKWGDWHATDCAALARTDNTRPRAAKETP